MADPLYFATAILQPFEGANGSTVFTDYGCYAPITVASGNVAMRTAQFKFGSSSAYFDGTGDYIHYNHNAYSQPGFVVDSDVTFEGWVRPDDFAVQRTIFGSRMSGIAGPTVYFDTSGHLTYANYGSVGIADSGVATALAWHHVALCTTNGGTTRLFLDGVQVGSTYSAATYPATINDLYLGTDSTALNDDTTKKFKGYMDEFRLTIGAARYTANFTPPGAMDLTPAARTYQKLASVIPLVTSVQPIALTVKSQFYSLCNLIGDTVFGGKGRIAGTVKEAGTPDAPVKRRVRLHRKIDGMLIRETWSAADGSYVFNGILIQPYYVVSFDHTLNYNAVIKDSIVPEVMP